MGRLEVLVVDDQLEVRDLLGTYFRSRGFLVSQAADGRAAISALERSPGRYGLVVTDLNLPGADGFAVLAAARTARPDCYVVIVTGYASLDSAIQAVRVGAYDYLSKPFSLGQLDVVLKRIREHASSERARLAVPAAAGLPAVAARVVPADAPVVSGAAPGSSRAAAAADPGGSSGTDEPAPAGEGPSREHAARLEARLAAIEQALARIEARVTDALVATVRQ